MDTIDRLMIGMERRMTKLLSVFSREHLRVQISRGGNSFTNLTKKVIRIAVYPFDECLPPEQLANAIKFLGYHEASHRRWTDISQSDVLHDEAFDLLKPLMGDKQSTMNFAHDILNSIEDGRIENSLVSEYVGLKSLRDWYRLRYRELSPVREGDSGFLVVRNDILSLATTGLHQKGFEEMFPPESDEAKAMDRLIPAITEYVTSKTMMEGKDAYLSIIKTLIDLYSPVLKKLAGPDIIELPEDLKEAILKSLEEQSNLNNESHNAESADNNHQVIGFLTDDAETDGEPSEDRPDILIDLRTKKPDANNKDEESTGNGNTTNSDDSSEENANQSKREDAESNSEENVNPSNSEEAENNSESAGNESKGCNTENKTDDVSNDSETKSSECNEKANSESGEPLKSSGDINSDSGNSQSGSDTDESQTESDKDESQSDSDAETSQSDEFNPNSDTLTKGADAFGTGYTEGVEERYSKAADKELIERVLDECLEKLSNMMDSADEYIQAKKEADVIKAESEETFGVPTQSELDDKAIELNIGRMRNTQINRVADYRSVPAPSYIKSKAGRDRRKIERYLKDIEAEALTGRYDGVFDKRAASKFIIGKSDVFMRRDIPSEFSSCAMIIKDDSSSMSWSEKEENAIGALAEIEEIFKGMIPLKIETFSTLGGNLSKVIKDWNDNDMSRNYAESYSRYNSPNGGNNDDFAILAASMQLLKRPEKNKLLIVIGDGEIPCPENVKKVIQWSRKQGIFIVFVFISESQEKLRSMEGRIKEVYEKMYTLCEPEKISDVLVNYMKKFIKL